MYNKKNKKRITYQQMQEKKNKLRRFIQIPFIISVFIGLFLFQQNPQNLKDTYLSLKGVYNGLEKNYIINVRPVDDQTECNQNEIAISTQIMNNNNNSTYDLNYIEIGEENNKQMIRLCSEIHFDYNFISLKQKNDIKEQNDCFYKGISFKSYGETGKCPISDIKFSSEESIANYEKIKISNSNKLNIFVKRSDPNSVPLNNIYLSQESFNDTKIVEIENTSFCMEDICIKYYKYFQNACQQQQKPKQIKFSLFKQSHFPIHCDGNAEFLNYETQYNLFLERFSVKKDSFKNIIKYFYSILLYLIMFSYLIAENIIDKTSSNYFFLFSFQFYFTYDFHYTLLQHFRYVIQLLEEISYFDEDPLKTYYENAQISCWLLTFFICFQIILFFSDFVLAILPKCNSNSALKYNELQELEIQTLN